MNWKGNIKLYFHLQQWPGPTQIKNGNKLILYLKKLQPAFLSEGVKHFSLFIGYFLLV